jgi:hypothetical protein
MCREDHRATQLPSLAWRQIGASVSLRKGAIRDDLQESFKGISDLLRPQGREAQAALPQDEWFVEWLMFGQSHLYARRLELAISDSRSKDSEALTAAVCAPKSDPVSLDTGVTNDGGN